MTTALWKEWESDRKALAWRLGLLLWATGVTAFEIPQIAPAGRGAWFLVGHCVLGVMITCVVIWVRIRFRLRTVKKCLRCFVRNDGAAKTCRRCGADFSEVSTDSMSPALWEVPYAVRRNRAAIALFLAICLTGAILVHFAPPGLERLVGVPLWAMLFIAYDIIYGLFFRRVQDSLAEHDGCLCIRCAYPIEASMKRCPECGRGCSIEEAKEMWTRAGVWLPPHTLDGRQNEPRV